MGEIARFMLSEPSRRTARAKAIQQEKTMNKIKKLVGKTALAAIATGFATALVALADTGSSSCSDAGGSKYCASGSGVACCIHGFDSTGAEYNTHDCCPSGKQCGTKYTNGTTVYGGSIDTSLTVSISGCI
jgi:hypothetical protein